MRETVRPVDLTLRFIETFEIPYRSTLDCTKRQKGWKQKGIVTNPALRPPSCVCKCCTVAVEARDAMWQQQRNSCPLIVTVSQRDDHYPDTAQNITQMWYE